MQSPTAIQTQLEKENETTPSTDDINTAANQQVLMPFDLPQTNVANSTIDSEPPKSSITEGSSIFVYRLNAVHSYSTQLQSLLSDSNSPVYRPNRVIVGAGPTKVISMPGYIEQPLIIMRSDVTSGITKYIISALGFCELSQLAIQNVLSLQNEFVTATKVEISICFYNSINSTCDFFSPAVLEQLKASLPYTNYSADYFGRSAALLLSSPPHLKQLISSPVEPLFLSPLATPTLSSSNVTQSVVNARSPASTNTHSPLLPPLSPAATASHTLQSAARVRSSTGTHTQSRSLPQPSPAAIAKQVGVFSGTVAERSVSSTAHNDANTPRPPKRMRPPGNTQTR